MMCTKCPLGQYCATSGLSLPTGPCNGGYYCLEGSYTPTPNGAQLTGDICPKAHYCPAGSSQPLACDAGTHNPDLGRDMCFPCLAGFYCPTNSTESDLSCPVGHYCPEGTQFATQYPCPQGYYNGRTERTSLEDCIPCPPGMYCGGSGLSSPSGPCDGGWYCTLASLSATPIQSVYTSATSNTSCTNSTGGQCQEGFYCPVGSSSPLPCLGGHYCELAGLVNISGSCLAGYYCSGEATSATPTDGITGNICPPGFYCPEASTSQTACPLGTFSNNTGNTHLDNCTSCLEGYGCSQQGLTQPNELCSEGYYCPTGQTSSRPPEYICELGHRCPEGTANQVQCDSGQYQDVVGSAVCKTCPEGFYCDGLLQNGSDCALGVSQPMPCPAGSYCPQGTMFADQYLCPEGTFSSSLYLSNMSQCQSCSEGYYCASRGQITPTGMCSAGYYCTGGSNTSTPVNNMSGDRCPAGYFCNAGANSPSACPPGTFNPNRGAINDSYCLQCTGGQYCEGYSLSTPSGLCNASYYCAGGATSPTPTDSVTGGACTLGHYCPPGTTTPIPCPEGEYTNETHSEVCYMCTAGSYCPGEGNTEPITCPAGFVCPTGTSMFAQRCLIGTYSSSNGLSNHSECLPCDAGYYCDSPGQTAVTAVCSAGYFCVSGSTTATPDAGVCTSGSYCPEGSATPQNCPRGTFSSLTQATSLSNCTSCSPGRYCETQGLTEPTGICAAGYFCLSGAVASRPNGSLTDSGPCPVGHYCPAETATPQPCNAGTYASTMQLEVCSSCPDRFYCPRGTSDYTLYPCIPGHYCPSGTQRANQHPCPKGTYHNITGARSAAACLPCPSGEFCDTEGLNASSGSCSAGWYCTGLAQSFTPMSPLLSLVGDTLQCTNTSTGGVCPIGSYCPEGSSMPRLCTPGYYCNTTGLSAVTGPCDAGYYCNGSSPVSNPVGAPYGSTCPSGFYCPEATGSPLPCPLGTFSVSSSNTDINNCLPCTAGRYCSSPALSAPNGICGEGVYCPLGQSNPEGLLCPVGHRCPRESDAAIPCESGSYQPSQGQSVCFECPAGFYCDMSEATLQETGGANSTTHGVVNPTDCIQGYFCPNGTSYARSFPCPVGTFSNMTRLQSEDECTPCTTGYYCGSAGSTSPSNKCDAGFVCLEGSSTPQPNGIDRSSHPCPMGMYCEGGCTSPVPCPVGTFNNITHLTSVEQCSQCSPGQYCNTTGLVLPSGNCFAGYYCTLGSTIPNPTDETFGDICSRGHYCCEGSAQPQACTVGTYQPYLGATSSDNCLPCDPGTYCAGTGLTTPSGNCSAGYYCSEAAISAQPSTNTSGGGICPLGHQCPMGSAAPRECLPGTYSNITGTEVCFTCPAGYYCVDSVSVSQCDAGFYCPMGTGYEQQPCPRGTYNPTTGADSQSDCLPCDPGRYCDAPGISAPTGNCNEGFYCQSGVNIQTPSGGHLGDGAVCPPGSFCPEASFQPTPCQQGTYNNLTTQSSCLDCPQGYYCPSNTSDYSIYPCMIGHYCPTSTEYFDQHPCPEGTYNNRTHATSTDDCLMCPPGKYCAGEGLSSYTGECNEGYYCVLGSPTATPSATSNATQLSECSCPLVPYVGGSCWPGSYCPQGTSYPLSCPSGMYCNSSQQSSPTGLCDEGYWCSGNATQPAPLDSPCPAGYFCVRGTTSPSPCPSSTYGPSTGSDSVSGCQPCDPGYYCNQPGLSSLEGLCSSGFYCPLGSNTSTPSMYECPSGHYCPIGSSYAVPCDPGSFQPNPGADSCLDCPEGSYCSNFSSGGITTPIACPKGYYCLGNTTSSNQYPCPEGTFNNNTGLVRVGDCSSCPAGMYCSRVALTEPSGNCSAGYVCFSQATGPTPMDGITGWPCPSGQYCPSGSTTGVDCPPGTFNNDTGLVSEEQCQECPPGSYCSSYGLSVPTGLCFAGYYCTGGAIDPNPNSETYGSRCLPGQHCLEGSSFPEPCPVGTYSPLFGNDMLTDCIPCDPGRYCSLMGQTNYTGLCDEGYYCSRGANTSQPTDGITGDICPEAHYCPEGTSSPIICGAGTYMPQVGAADCLSCPTGLRCINGIAGLCAPGHYCPEGTGHDPEPCPVGTYSNSMNLTDISGCSPCLPGYFCSNVAATSPEGPCSSGFYCTSGVNTSHPINGNHTGVGGQCTLGHFCQEMSGAPSPCPPGSYADQIGLGACKTCPPGYYCPTATIDFAANPCPSGYFCLSGTQFGTEHPCHAGTYNNLTGQISGESCLDCPPGMYCLGMGNSHPTGTCDPGWYCLRGADTSTPNDTITGNQCTAGSYCPRGSPQPIPCSLGMYCTDDGLSEPTGNCSAGYFCNGSATSPSPSSSLCPAGFYCASGTTSPVGCPPGYFSSEEGNTQPSDCSKCTPGYFCAAYGLTSPSGPCESGYHCPEGQSSSTAFLCPKGHFCINGTAVPVPCPSGFYQPREEASSCEDCPAGRYCDATDLDFAGCVERYNDTVGVYNPAVCPQGHYCLLRTAQGNQYPCPEGTYSNNTGLSDDSNCTVCPGGYYCATQGLTTPTGICSGGHYCTEGAVIPNPVDGTTGDVCGEGFYCPPGSAVGIRCPVGTFNNISGLTNETQCTLCTPGYFCDNRGLVSPTGPCNEGHYCSVGAASSNPVNSSYGDICFSGHYCPQATSVPRPCPPGTFYNSTGAESEDDCYPCPPGEYCEGSGLVRSTGSCSEGFYCASGANSSRPIGSTNGGECSIGHYCPPGSVLPQSCSDGTYMNHSQAAMCYNCPAGFYCTRMTAADPCPPGFFCPEGTGSEIMPCPVGSYNPATGLSNVSQCTACDPGKYCQHPGISSPTGTCAGGHYCTQGVNTSSPIDYYTGEGGICPPAHYCPNGSVNPVGCPAGTFSNQTGLSQCLECPKGFYCLSNLTNYEYSPCPKGHYCLSGTTFAEQYPCPSGTFNNLTGAQTMESCITCTPGMYCEGEGNLEPTGLCAAGWYCSGGAAVSRPLGVDNSTVPACSSNNTGNICPTGSYCPEGSSEPIPCTAGQYCAQTGLSSPTGPCLAGFYCEAGSSLANQTSCSAGHFCPEGTAVPMPCPAGTFSPDIGNSMESNCLPCTPAYSCQSEGLTAPDGVCSEGYYCPEGQASLTPEEYLCPRGKYCPENSSQPISCPSGMYQSEIGQPQCIDCPEGFYCDGFEQQSNSTSNATLVGTIYPTICQRGYYCPQNTEYSNQFACPFGMFNNRTRLSHVDQCTDCIAGHYCDVDGLTEPSGPCNAGYLCYQSATSPTPTDGVTGEICPTGGYCPQGSSVLTPCETGTYNNQTGLRQLSECTPCAPGMYCETPGLSLPTGECSAGYYCIIGATQPNPVNDTSGDICTPGNYCPQGTHTPVQCPPGTFRNTSGGMSVEDCSACSPGHYCEGYGLSSVSGRCAVGYYCELGANTSSPMDGITGDICPIGHFCTMGSILPTSCLAGTYSNTTGVNVCLSCPEGFYCIRGDEPDPCLAGHYCPQGTGHDVRPCPRGTYSSQEGLSNETQCTPCDGGHYCDSEGSTSVSGICSAGYYCQQGVDTSTPSGEHRGTGEICPVGHMCPQGTVIPQGCPAGTFQSLTGQAECDICPPGYFCLVNASMYTEVCVTGHFCPEGTKYSTQHPCPIGTYNNNTGRMNNSDCVLCDAGSYCDAAGLSEPTGYCDAGYYCVLGAVTATPRPSLSQAYQLMLMGSLVYSFLNETGSICPVGHFCPQGSGQPQPCSPGTFCPQEGLAEPVGLCSAGYHCPIGAPRPDYQPCEPGHFCPDGTSTQLKCPPGTFTNASLNTVLDDCTNCTSGHYCDGYGLIAPNSTCDPGYYCPGGQSSPTPLHLACTPGHFCPRGSHNQTGCPAGQYQPHWAAANCLTCPEAYYCNPVESSCPADFNFTSVCSSELDVEFSSLYINTLGVATPRICPAGSVCPNGTEHSTQFLCPSGSYSNTTGLWAIFQCTPCPAGLFCAGQGLTSPSGLCAPGYYCNEGSSSATPNDNITGGECPRGRYCLAGSVISASVCPIGTFNNLTGLGSIAECQPCPPGHYCPSTGLEEPFGLCDAGYYCISGSPMSNPSNASYGDQCPPGHYCSIGTSTPAQCPVGTFLPTSGSTSSDDCLLCSSGMYCEYSGQSAVTGQCSAGFYCISNSSTPTPLDGITGDVCPNASYCPVGSSQPLTCPNATFMNHTGAESCYICPEGYYCVGTDTPIPCPQGYYCEEGTGLDWLPCPVGAYGSREGLSSSEQCMQCTGGYYCDMPGATNVSGSCSEGYYCTIAVTTATPSLEIIASGDGSYCPVGHYCPEASPLPVPCVAGTYAPSTGLSLCLPCMEGYYCLEGSFNTTANPCPQGYYCPQGTAGRTQFPCPPGTYNPYITVTNMNDCLPCPGGMFCEGNANIAPSGSCSAGYYCTSGAFSPTPNLFDNLTLSLDTMCADADITGGRCYPGSFCPNASTIPISCTPGMYCGEPGLSGPSGPCLAGYYCNGSDISPTPDNKICPKGHYCLQQSATPTPCPTGTFSNQTGNQVLADCQPCLPGYVCDSEGTEYPINLCAPGYFCPEGQNSSTPSPFMCPIGYLCPRGSSQPVGCEPGYYQDETSQESCKVCPQGYYCDSVIAEMSYNVTGIGTITPLPCPAGYYCINGTTHATQYPCAMGTYSNTTMLGTSSECTPCTSGYYCASEGLTSPTDLCGAGHFCSLGASVPIPSDGTTGDICPLGHFCLEGSQQGQPCPAGTFNNITGLQQASQCRPCSPGKYCSSNGLTAPTGDCSPGYYCSLRSPEASPLNTTYGSVCPVGHFCEEGSPTPEACPPGSYLPTEGATRIDNCLPCSAGFYCEEAGLANVSGPCSAGYYCVINATSPAPTDGLMGGVCFIGHYCMEGSVSPVPCSNGTYSNITGAEMCLSCPEGFYCIRGDEPDPCLAGHYCPQGTGHDVRPCPRGTYSSQEGLRYETQCTPCDGGHYCDSEGSTSVSGMCSAGYYCRQGVDTSTPSGEHRGTGGKCPVGHMCPQGTVNPQGCLVGTYQDQMCQSSCNDCPGGYFCIANSVTYSNVCSSGYYCPIGTRHPFEYPCPAGTYNPSNGSDNINDCLLCPPGMFCQTDGLSAPSGFCDGGYYCSNASIIAAPLAVSSMELVNITSLTQVYDSCPYFTVQSSGDICPVGYFCPQGSGVPNICPPGMFCGQTGLVAPEGPCNAGYYCNEGSTSPQPMPCSAGHYCPQGTTVEIDCLPGTFSNETHNRNVTDCVPCTPGMFCSGSELITPSGLCLTGYYCPEGQSTSTPGEYVCSPGHFCPEGTPEQLGCPSGYFQQHNRMSTCEICPQGYYCAAYNDYNSSYIIDLGMGLFVNYSRSELGVSTPVECPRGSFCPNGTKYSTEYLCPQGTFSNSTGLSSMDHCTSCLAGMFCDVEGATSPSGLCAEGYVCFSGAVSATPTDNTIGGLCPRGRYCNAGSSFGAPCPPGTFNSLLGIANISHCQPCSPGSHCPTAGLVNVVGSCSEGHICWGGSPESNPVNKTYGDFCPAGFYCPQGIASPVPCPAGTYLPELGGRNVDDCLPCMPSYYCSGIGQSNVTGQCSAGFYCISNSSTPTPLDGITGDVCPNASYCPIGSSQPLTCPNTTFMNHTGAESCYICPEGYYCLGTDTPIPCPQGYYCEEGTGLDWLPCPEGTYGSREGLSISTQCSECSGGYYCNDSALTSPSGQCSPGYFCNSGIVTATPSSDDQGIGGECPIAHYCPTGTINPQPCDAGSYNPSPRQSNCLECPQGFFCPPNSTTFTETPCPVGYYCVNGTGYGSQFPCPAGTVNNKTMATSLDDCIACSPGKFCEGRGLSEPTGDCQEGYYCYSGSNTPTPVSSNQTMNGFNINNCSCAGGAEPGGRCWPGTYCPTATGCPLSCTPGMYCAGYELAVPTGPCSEGYFCSGGASTSAPVEGICHSGHYCPVGSSSPIPCPSGTFLSSTGNPNISYCVPCLEGMFCSGVGLSSPEGDCLEGYYCPEGQNSSNPFDFTCPSGTFCASGSQLPERCPAGFYQPNPGRSSCLSCPSGFYCDPEPVTTIDVVSGVTIGVVEPILCLPGYYCPEETMFARQYPCPSGTYSNTTGLHSVVGCTSCPEGDYCGDEGLLEPTGDCSPGYFCVINASISQPTDGVTGNVCPKGKYCPEGVSFGIPCPVGTFNNRTGNTNISECTSCLPGHYCDTEGLVEPSERCVAGYYCVSGAVRATPTNLMMEGGEICPPGHVCPTGAATPIPCDVGFYQPNLQAQNMSACLPCEPGSYCNASGLAESSGLCAGGFYCGLGASVPEPLDGIAGNICPIGAECPMGSSTFIPCADGTYSNQTGLSSCYICPSGQYCVFMDHAEACPQGYFCLEGTGYNYTGCPSGTYGDREGLKDVSECTQCDGGYYCSGTAKVNVTGQCAGGYYCEYGVNFSRPSSAHTGVGDICPVGNQCPHGSSLPIPCPAGSFASSVGQESCSLCPAGYYCVSGSVNGVVCPVGNYCPEGTASEFEHQCPIGSYNNYTGATAESDCLACLPGHYCASSGLTLPSGRCEPGYYCSLGSMTPRPVDIDVNYTDFNSACPVSINATGGICPIGHFCPEGSSHPIPCTGGMYCPSILLSAPFDKCREGYFCNRTSHIPDQYVCPTGHYCPNGSSYPMPCPAGTFLPTEMNTAIEDCELCSPGMYCDSTGLSAPSGNCSDGYFCPGTMNNARSAAPADLLCLAGHYCPEASFEPLLCLPGTYQPERGQRSCLECPSSYYCDPSEGVEAVISPPACPQGFYCPSGTDGTQPVCPSGTFGGRIGLESIDDCTECTSGMYCEGEAITSPTGPCFAGYFCTGGSSSPTPSDNVTVYGNSSWNGNGECPVGYYCPLGSRVPTPCPTGSFSQSRAVTNASGCEPCPRGRYCSFTGPVMVTEAPPCSGGYVCTGGSPTPTPEDGSLYGYPCPTGHFCEEGTLYEVGCLPGEYNPSLAQSSCNTCPERQSCPDHNMTTPLDCIAGHYCPNGTSLPLPCPEGTFTTSTNLSSVEECSYCTSGSYCATPGLADPTGPCTAGYYCQGGAANSIPSSLELFTLNGLCPEGHYCTSGTTVPTPCPIGTFLDSPGGYNVSSCRPCLGGSFCNGTGLTSPSGLCSAGYYCPQGSTVRQPIEFVCPEGMYCPEGVTLPLPCLPGEYQQHPMQAECEACPAGRTCVNSTADPALCPAHHYCPRGTGLNPPECPPGTYTDADVMGLILPTSCLPCKVGRYCRNGVISGNCSAGYFCVSSNSIPTPNASLIVLDTNSSGYNMTGTYNVTVNLTSACDPQSPHPIIGGLCPANHYCLEGTTEPTPCPDHTYNPNEGGSKVIDCNACPEGMYCLEGESTPLPCPVGHYCPTGSMPIPCAIGRYRNETGGNNLADCFTCPQGYWCNMTGVIDYTYHPCPLGFFCPEGTVVPLVCPAGTMGNASGAGLAEDCEPCRPGYYCPPRFCTPEVILTANSSSNMTCDMDTIKITSYNSSVLDSYLNDSSLDYNISCPSLCNCGVDVTDDSHINGIPCSTKHWCPLGSTEEQICPGGYTCGPITGDPEPCSAGYYCPPGSDNETKCVYPTYCPALSPTPLYCRAGWIAVTFTADVENLRTAENNSCQLCPSGHFTNDSLLCYPCPAGYYCPEGSSNPYANPCQAGFYCPEASEAPLFCPPGTYRPNKLATMREDCLDCVNGTYNNLEAQSACKPCGSSARSSGDATTCICVGRNRQFFPSDGTCICFSGYVYYDEADKRESEADSNLDCQPLVSSLCVCACTDCASVCVRVLERR